MERSYRLTRAEALEAVRALVPDFSEEEFDRWQELGRMDCIELNGEPRYLASVAATLLKSYPEFWERAGGDRRDYSAVDDLLIGLEDGQPLAAHIHLKHELWAADPEETEAAGTAGSPDPEAAAMHPGQSVRVHVPFPRERQQIRALRALDLQPPPVRLPEEGEGQPTVYFEAEAAEGQVFSVEYEFDFVTEYVDMNRVDHGAVTEAWEAGLPEDVRAYLAEEPPHMTFTPRLRSLADELAAGESDPLIIARNIYNYITTQVEYRFVRPYRLIDHIAEYCAETKRGDCGLQAVLFITLCRIAGIPARWQSGLDAKPGDIGAHDWAQFYVPSLGWRGADLSYGGDAYIRGAYERWNFFFGNLDPYRVPINDAFMSDLMPAKDFERDDPCDNQIGEIELANGPVLGSDLKHRFTDLGIKRIK